MKRWILERAAADGKAGKVRAMAEVVEDRRPRDKGPPPVPLSTLISRGAPPEKVAAAALRRADRDPARAVEALLGAVDLDAAVAGGPAAVRRFAEPAILDGFARRAAAEPALLARLPIALKHLYDADVLDEDAIVAWGGRAAPDARRAAEPLLAWLAEADSDSDSEEDAGD